MSNSGAEAGWYPDPNGGPRQRYFDGAVWTEHYNDDAPAADRAFGSSGGGYASADGAPVADLKPFDYWKKVVLKNYANFSGRARRAEYWWAYLINIVIPIVLVLIGVVLGDVGVVLLVVAGLWILATIIPMIACLVRRLHDTNKPGWYYFISLVPFIGGIIVLVFLATEGDAGSNQYGARTK